MTSVKKTMMFGAMMGFALGLAMSYWQQTSSETAFWRGCVGAMTGGFLMRWWAGVLAVNLHQALAEKAAAEQKQQAESSAFTPPAPVPARPAKS